MNLENKKLIGTYHFGADADNARRYHISEAPAQYYMGDPEVAEATAASLKKALPGLNIEAVITKNERSIPRENLTNEGFYYATYTLVRNEDLEKMGQFLLRAGKFNESDKVSLALESLSGAICRIARQSEFSDDLRKFKDPEARILNIDLQNMPSGLPENIGMRLYPCLAENPLFIEKLGKDTEVQAAVATIADTLHAIGREGLRSSKVTRQIRGQRKPLPPAQNL